MERINYLLDERYFISKKTAFYFSLSIAIGCLNFLVSNIAEIAAILSILQIMYLGYCFIKRDYIEYICVHLIFTTMSLEFDYYLGGNNIYGFKYWEFLGINLPFVTILPIFFIAVFDLKKIYGYTKGNALRRFLMFSIAISIISLVIGFGSILLNINNIQAMPNVFFEFLYHIYTMIGLTIFPIVVYSFAVYKNKCELCKCIKGIFLAIIVVMLISALTNIKGSYGGGDTLFVTYAFFYIPIFLLFYLYMPARNHKLTYFIVGAVGFFLSWKFSLMGKMVLLSGFIMCLHVILLLFSKKKNNYILFFVICSISIIGISFLFEKMVSGSALFEWKIEQVKDLLSFWKSDWFNSMDGSPKIRLCQFIEIFKNNITNPIWLFFGKGILGTYIDYGGFLSTVEWNPSYCSEWEYINNTFYTAHESINILFLNNGLLGIYYLAWTVLTGIKNLKKSFYLIVGIVWIVFFYAFSITISCIGIACLVIGISEVRNRTCGRKEIK